MSAQGQGHGEAHDQGHVQSPTLQHDCWFRTYGCKNKALGVGDGACGACIVLTSPFGPFRTARKRKKLTILGKP
jgi:hypothetical protein